MTNAQGGAGGESAPAHGRGCESLGAAALAALCLKMALLSWPQRCVAADGAEPKLGWWSAAGTAAAKASRQQVCGGGGRAPLLTRKGICMGSIADVAAAN